MNQPTGCERDALRIIAAHIAELPEAESCWNRIAVAMAERQQAGIGEYGQPLADNPAPLKARLQHLWEELLDAQAYAAWIRRGASPCVPGAECQAHLTSISIHALTARCLYELDRVMQMLKQEEA